MAGCLIIHVVFSRRHPQVPATLRGQPYEARCRTVSRLGISHSALAAVLSQDSMQMRGWLKMAHSANNASCREVGMETERGTVFMTARCYWLTSVLSRGRDGVSLCKSPRVGRPLHLPT